MNFVSENSRRILTTVYLTFIPKVCALFVPYCIMSRFGNKSILLTPYRPTSKAFTGTQIRFPRYLCNKYMGEQIKWTHQKSKDITTTKQNRTTQWVYFMINKIFRLSIYCSVWWLLWRKAKPPLKLQYSILYTTQPCDRRIIHNITMTS